MEWMIAARRCSNGTLLLSALIWLNAVCLLRHLASARIIFCNLPATQTVVSHAARVRCGYALRIAVTAHRDARLLYALFSLLLFPLLDAHQHARACTYYDVRCGGKQSGGIARLKRWQASRAKQQTALARALGACSTSLASLFGATRAFSA